MDQKKHNSTTRKKCERCQNPTVRCLCEFTPHNLCSPMPTIILQYKDESHHYLNTAKILALSLKNVFLYSAKEFDLTEIIATHNPQWKNLQWYLLFPNDEAKTIAEIKCDTNFHAQNFGLIIIDGTWKKAKKIFYTHSFLKNLISIKLQNNYPSAYELRICHRENFLSTLEAFSYFLAEFGEEKLGSELRLRKAKMIEQQKNLLLK